MKRRAVLALSAALSLLALGLTARALSWSRIHPFPIFDEVGYIDMARDFSERGGPAAVPGCYLRGECREDNRHPLYAMLLAPFMSWDAGDFTDGKLLSLGTALLLCAVLFFAAGGGKPEGRLDGSLAAALAAVSPATAYAAHFVMADALFAALFAASIAAAARARAKSGWVLSGALAGMAYLAKGNGHFLAAAWVAVGVSRHGARFFRRPDLYLALGAFAATAGFLLARNAWLWGNPFHNAHNRIVWLDRWTDYWELSTSAEWARLGPGWYLARHSVGEAAARLAWGVVSTGSMLLQTLGSGPMAWRLPSGALVAAAAALGLRRQWSRHPDAALAAGAPALLLFLAFSWSARPMAPDMRYFLPLAAALWPFAALEAAARLRAVKALAGRELQAAAAGAAVAAAAALAWSPGAFRDDPRALWAEPPSWTQTAAWLRTNAPGEAFLIDDANLFSLWPCCRDLRRPFPLEAPRDRVLRAAAARGVRYAVLDARTIGAESDAEKYGARDARGPRTFVGWRRCHAADGEPSPLLIYSPSCPRRRS